MWLGELVGGVGVLGGANTGRLHKERLLGNVAAEPSAPAVAFLDFAGVEIATASWVREAVIGFRDCLRGRRSNWYPVVSGLAVDVREEFLILLRQRSDVLLECDRYEDGELRGAAPLGILDEKQRMTFELVNSHLETDAGELMRAYGKQEGTRHQTAWNNRLSGLATQGLVAEISRGRSKRYRTLLRPVDDQGNA